MKSTFTFLFKALLSGLLFIICQHSYAQTSQPLSIRNYAIWGGSAAPGRYVKEQGVFLKGSAIIKGDIGSNHFIDVKEGSTLTGNLYSGNGIDLKANAQVTGNLFAWKSAANFSLPAIAVKAGSAITGNLTANGKIDIKSGGGPQASVITGKVTIPAPSSSFYSGPAPSLGVANSPAFPVMPLMPGLTPFDNQAGTVVVNTGRTLLPGRYKSIELKGNQNLTFQGPGNYIFESVNNIGTNNNIIFDLNNTTEGTINIFIIKDAKWGKITVKAIQGNPASRIFTEVHGNGSSIPGTEGGFAFDAEAPGVYPSGRFLWLGNVYAPNGGISIKGTRKSDKFPHIRGALWSGTVVDVKSELNLVFDAPAATSISYIEPYYTPPAQGKVDSANNIIGAELTSLSLNPSTILGIPDNEIFRFDGNGNVMIEVISKSPNDNTLLAQLISQGMTGVINNGPHTYIITGYFPISQLPQLNNNPLIEYVRPLYPPVLNNGQVTTQGDKTMKTDMVRNRFGLDGSGVKIGVLSDSYNAKTRAQDDVDQEDLPGVKSSGTANDNPTPVQVLRDYTTGGSDEGRAMLQIVHDISPKSALAFRTGFLSAGDFANGILELASPTLAGGKCDIIVDDLSYITEPFFRDGVVAKTVDQVVSQGVTYFTSAGNFGKRSYEATFNGVTNTTAIPAPAMVHQFGSNPSEIYQSILLKPGTYTIVMQWDDEFHSLGDNGVMTDLDLYLVGANGFTLFGFNRSNISKDPFEVCPFTVKEETMARIMVVRASGTNNVRFKYIIFRGDATIQNYNTGNSTIVGHANAKGAISVGAMLYDSIPGITPVWPGVASFSSRGGTSVLENNAFTVRNKPEIIAPNGVNTTVNLGGASFNDGDTYPNFFGTSAAAPHAAGVAGLLIQGRKKFNMETNVTPDQIRQQIISSAGKFSYLPSTFSFEGGYGYIRADQATLEIANARPIVDTIMSVTPGGETGSQPFTVKVTGKYLTDSTVIQVRGVPVPTQVSDDKTEATATVPALNGIDQPFQLVNPAKSESGEDGGASEPIYFFGGNQKEVTVRATNKTRFYKQQNPAFDIDVLVDGIPLNQTGLTLQELKLDAANLSFETIATADSRPGNYGIFVSRSAPLQPGDSLLIKYAFNFVSGTLFIEKLPLKITPKNLNITYGEFPENIEYTYELPAPFNTDSILLDEVKAIHRQYIPDNGLVVVNGITSTGHGVNLSDFDNMGVLASYQSLMNARKLNYQNGLLKPLTDSLNTDNMGEQRFMIDLDVNSVARYKLDSTEAEMVPSYRGTMPRGLLNLKELTKGSARAAEPNGQLKAMVNGQLQAMVNGDIEAMVNGQLKAMVNGTYQDAADITFINGQLKALVNGVWVSITNGQLRAMVNGANADFELSVVNGQLRAVVNGQLMPIVNGQLRAVVNGQLVAIVNGQLKAMVNGQLVPVVNGQLVAIVNGQLKAMVNGQLRAMVNGNLMVLENGELEEASEFSYVNGQLRAVVNGQLRAVVNGQLKAMVNGVVTDVPTTSLTMINGQLRAVVNGQLVAVVNGQLRAVVNGQLKALVNGEAIGIEKAIQMANGQLKAMVNGTNIPIKNGQLQAMVNGQLLAMVNGQLMALVNGELTFVVFQNGQLKALINGQLQAMVNGQLKAMVNGNLQPVDSYSIANGQLKAMVNGEEWVFPNGQLKAVVNGQLKAMVNSFDVSGSNNNTRAVVVVDEDDVLMQSGDLGIMYAVPMITGNTGAANGQQKIIPAAFLSENYTVSYGTGDIFIQKAPLVVKPADTSRQYGDANPAFRRTYTGLAFDDSEFTDFYPPEVVTVANQHSNVGTYPLTLSDVSTQSNNYFLLDDYNLYETGTLTITPAPLTIKADDKNKIVNTENPPLTITYTGLKGDDTADSICAPNPATFYTPSSPVTYYSLDRNVTFSDVKINGVSNVFYATPGQALSLSGQFVSYNIPNMYCPGCITQFHVGMGDGVTNFFTTCYESTGSGTTANLAKNFTAPAVPGVYYITFIGTWWYYCGQFPLQNHKTNNTLNDAIAVVIVGNGGGSGTTDKISVSTTANLNSPEGTYPITVSGCGTYNPNYTVTVENGTMTVKPTCITQSHAWLADGNFNDQSGTGNGTPVGGVTATGEGKTGSLNSFSFNGTGYIATGTGGSVSGTGDFEVSAWVKTTGINPMVIIQQRDGNINGEYILKIGGSHPEMVYSPANSGKAYFMMFDFNNGVYEMFSNQLVNDGQWHFIKGQRKGNTMSLFVDGSLEATMTTPGLVNLDAGIRTFIGSDQRDYGAYFDGLIDEVRVSICNETMVVNAPNSVSPEMLSMVPINNLNVKVTENKLFPNPASHTIRVELTDDVKNINEIQVLDGFGKPNRTNARKINEGVYELNISGLPKGLYFIKARTEGGVKTLKFIKI